jgi:hypothetical protein
MNFLKNNLLGISAILLGIIAIIVTYTNSTILEDNKIKETINLDSIESIYKENYRLKLDSINQIHIKRINQLNKRNKQIESEIKDIDSTIGELPDFK